MWEERFFLKKGIRKTLCGGGDCGGAVSMVCFVYDSHYTRERERERERQKK